MDLVSEKWYLHSCRNKLSWIRSDDPKTNHPISETSVEAAEFTGHVKMKDRDGQWTVLPLDQLDVTKKSLSSQFKDSVRSRSKFIDKCLEVLQDKVEKSAQQTFEMETNSNKKGSEEERKLSSSLFSNKIVADCADVHISNLVCPDEERQCRPVDPNHVQRLKAQYQRSTTSFVVLVGLLTEPDVEIDRLCTQEKVTAIETLGGNHTRLAIQALLEDGEITDSDAIVKVRLYEGLTRWEALQIGYLHNKHASGSKDMTFVDVVRLMRPLLYGVEAKSAELTARKDKVRTILDLKNITTLNNNYKTHMNLSRSGPTLYNLALEVERQWDKGKIKGQPRKVEPIKQTKFSILNNKAVGEEEKEVAFRILLADGLKAFEMKTNPWKPKKKTTLTDDLSDITENDRVTDTVEDLDDEVVDDPVVEPTPDETEVLRTENSRLREDNDRLKDENATLKLELDELKKRLAEKGNQTNFMSSLQMKRKSDAGHGTKAAAAKQPKLNILPEKEEIQVGQLVMARWSENGIHYPATVLKKLKKSFKVRFTQDDIVENVKEKDIRHL